MTPKASHSPGSIPVWLRDTRWHGRHARSPHREDGRELLTEAHAAQATGAPLIDIRGDDRRRAYGLIPRPVLLPRKRAGMALRSGEPAGERV
jgi:hypothetical protein